MSERHPILLHHQDGCAALNVPPEPNTEIHCLHDAIVYMVRNDGNEGTSTLLVYSSLASVVGRLMRGVCSQSLRRRILRWTVFPYLSLKEGCRSIVFAPQSDWWVRSSGHHSTMYVCKATIFRYVVSPSDVVVVDPTTCDFFFSAGGSLTENFGHHGSLSLASIQRLSVGIVLLTV